MPSGACWNCKDRKVHCDLKTPRCKRCAQSNRDCRYGLRLSWPKPGDKRRSVKAAHSMPQTRPRRRGIPHLINAGFWDIQLHEYLSSSRDLQGLSVDNHVYPILPTLPTSISWNPLLLKGKELDLLEYFHLKASRSIGVFDVDRQGFYGLLLRLAMSDSSEGSKSVLHSALALSSIHRFGLQSEAARLKGRALTALATSYRHGMDTNVAIQHIAAQMMLCYFEIQDTENTPIQWLWYTCASKFLMHSSQLRSQVASKEYAAILDWVDYHVITNKFSLKHWHRFSEGQVNAGGDMNRRATPVVCNRNKFADISGCSHEILRLCFNVFDTVKRPSDASYHGREYAESVQNLSQRIRNVLPLSSNTMASSSTPTTHKTATLELYQLAALVYLERASTNFSGVSDEISSLTEPGFRILTQSDSCNAPLPLFILGLEARTDEQRITVLDVIERTRKTSDLKSVEGVRSMLQAAWTQDDLEADRDLDYVMKLDSLMSSHSIVPSFA